MRPDEVRQIEQKEQVMDNLSFDPNKGYSVAYPKNSLLKDLPKNLDSVKAKLIKNCLLAQFNNCLKHFIDAGVVAPIFYFPEMEGMQNRYIPLCYSLANNDQATTKLCICTNSSFRPSQNCPHLMNAASLGLSI